MFNSFTAGGNYQLQRHVIEPVKVSLWFGHSNETSSGSYFSMELFVQSQHFTKGNLRFFFNVLFPAFFVVRGVTPQTKEGPFNSRGLSAQTDSTLQLLVAKPFKENVSFLRYRLKSLKSSSLKNYVTCLPAMLPLCHAQQLRRPRPHFLIQLVLHVSCVRSLTVWTSTALLFFSLSQTIRENLEN